MFLEGATIFLMLLVLATKYLTVVHMNKLNQRLVEAENDLQRNQARLAQHTKERQAAEAQEKALQREKTGLEAEAENLREDLTEQVDRNKDIEDRINTMS
jgi:septal ring factor EnvC (AmiA/AmiB activator)